MKKAEAPTTKRKVYGKYPFKTNFLRKFPFLFIILLIFSNFIIAYTAQIDLCVYKNLALVLIIIFFLGFEKVIFKN